jgi:hypothetical protein
MPADAPPNLPVAASARTMALATRPPEGGVVTCSAGPDGGPVILYPRDAGLPLGAQLGVMLGMGAGWAAGLGVMASLLPPEGWAMWLTRAIMLAWTGGGSVLLARLVRMIQTRGRVALTLGTVALAARGTRGLSAGDDRISRRDAAGARLVRQDGNALLQVDGPEGRTITLAEGLPEADMAWLLETLHAWARDGG